jgi:uncharacterized protein YndB with AHSA1/START domain
MSDRSITHETFTIERTYGATADRVFAAWSDPAAKANWFGAPGGDHSLDFQVGGRELNRARTPDGTQMEFASTYHDIVDRERIVYASTLTADGVLSTVSLTSVELTAEPERTRLVLVEHGAYLDGHERPEWRERGTGDWLDALGRFVENAAARSTST